MSMIRSGRSISRTSDESWERLELFLPELLDFALGTPEAGAVNLNILRHFLHVLLRLVDGRDIKVEYRGADAIRLKNLLASRTNGPTLDFHDYDLIERSSKNNVVPPRVEERGSDEGVGETTEETSERSLDSNDRTIPEIRNVETSPISSSLSVPIGVKISSSISENRRDSEQIVSDENVSRTKRYETRADGPEKAREFEETLAERTPNETKSVVRDLLLEEKEVDIPSEGRNRSSSIEEEEERPSIRLEIHNDSNRLDVSVSREESLPRSNSSRRVSVAPIERVSVRSIENVNNKIDEETRSMVTIAKKKDIELTLRRKLFDSNEKIRDDEESSPSLARIDRDPEVRVRSRIEEIETTNLDRGSDNDEKKEKEEGEEEEVNAKRTRTSRNSDDINDLIAKVEGVKSEVENTNRIANRLLDERENRDTDDIGARRLAEEIRTLTLTKVDKEYVENALAGKADTRTVNAKVSYDQFDAACDDLARCLEDTILKVERQCCDWDSSFEQMKILIEGKVDEARFSSLNEWIDKNVETLRKELDRVGEKREENTAAGTKMMLRNVRCISCDNNAATYVEEKAIRYAEGMPYGRSFKSFVANYDTKKARNQRRRITEPTNVTKRPRDRPIEHSRSEHHRDRYCGGSHTVTTPGQRVTRIARFSEEWGPRVVRLTERFRKGTDASIYRDRDINGKSLVSCCSCGRKTNTDSVRETTPGDLSEASEPPGNASSVGKIASTTRRSVERKSLTSTRPGDKSGSLLLRRNISEPVFASSRPHLATPSRINETEAGGEEEGEEYATVTNDYAARSLRGSGSMLEETTRRRDGNHERETSNASVIYYNNLRSNHAE